MLEAPPSNFKRVRDSVVARADDLLHPHSEQLRQAHPSLSGGVDGALPKIGTELDLEPFGLLRGYRLGAHRHTHRVTHTGLAVHPRMGYHRAMTPPDLAAWLLAASARLLDASGHAGHPSQAVVDAIASEATADPVAGDQMHTAALLLVIAFRESSYRVNVQGDGGHSCGLYQTPCPRTPHDAPGQTRLALAILRQSFTACPDAPLAPYASGSCSSSAGRRISAQRIAQAKALLSE